MAVGEVPAERPVLWERPVLALNTLTWEKLLYAGLFLIAVVSRFWDLGARAMSHDESLHTTYSWYLYAGRGFQASPLMHGPSLFEITALNYWLFGDSDYVARLFPAAIGIFLAIGIPLLLRRWLGRAGALAAATFLVISPAVLFHSRYIRHDVPIIAFTCILFVAIMAYHHRRQSRYLYWAAAALGLMFTTMETSFIYTFIFGSFLVVYFLPTFLSLEWQQPRYRTWFYVSIAAIVVLGMAVLVGNQVHTHAISGTTPIQPGTAEDAPVFGPSSYSPFILIATLLLGPVLAAAVFFLIRGVGDALKGNPTFDLMIVVGSLAMTNAGAALVKVAGYDPLDKGPGMMPTMIAVAVLVLSSAAIGLLWDRRRWLIAAGIYYAIFITLFTTFFTNGGGIGTGFVESLGYWLNQQAVRRGGQPTYYYLILMPIYEYLALTGFVAAAILYVRRLLRDRTLARQGEGKVEWRFEDEDGSQPVAEKPGLLARLTPETRLFIPLLIWWALLAFAVFSYAGEKMPWLITHLTTPMLLLSGWFVGQMIVGMDWRSVWNRGGWAIALLLLVSVAALVPVVSPLLGGVAPFGGKDLNNLIATGQWLSGLVVAVGAIAGLVLLGQRLTGFEFRRLLVLIVFTVLSVLTVRTAFRMAYINYDLATEFMVYAHGAPGTTEVTSQIQDLSMRLTNTPTDLKIAYDDDSAWPFTWYFRNFRNATYYGDNPTATLRDNVVVLAGDKNWAKVDPMLQAKFDKFTYTFIWWPMEDYKNLTWDRIWNAISNPDMRGALWDIWFNRDYTKYGQLTNEKLTLVDWPLKHQLHFYVRKDVASTIWNFGVGAVTQTTQLSPVDKAYRPLTATAQFTNAGDGKALNAPRGVAAGPDGAIYVADSRNDRIVVFNPDGSFRLSFGESCPPNNTDPNLGCTGPDTAGKFHEPWGVAVGSDGSIYVADTWDHRIQKFDSQGKFVKMWGSFGTVQAGATSQSSLMWGPRGVAVGPDGNVYVADTGNKRILEFTPTGDFIGQIGAGGAGDGQLDEPVGIAFDSAGKIYVADFWNVRVSVFNNDKNHTFARTIVLPEGWESQTGEPRPYIAVDARGRIFITDPEGYRVMGFKPDGSLAVVFGQFGQDLQSFNQPTGIAVDKDGNVLVSDSGNNRVLKFAPIQ